MAAQPDYAGNALPATFANPTDDVEVRLLQIAASLGVDRPTLLADSLRWYRVAFHHRDVPEAYLPATLAAIEAILEDELPGDLMPVVRDHLSAATEGLHEAPVDVASHLSKSAPHGELAMRFLLGNLEGRAEDSLDLIRAALRDGASVAELQDHVLSPAQREVGRMWVMGEIPIADEHYSSSVVERALWMLQERVPRAPEGAPVVLSMAVGGNLHDLGLRMVAQRFQLAGFSVHHLGANMPGADLDWALRDHKIDLVAMSAAMLLHIDGLREGVSTLRQVFLDMHGDERARPIMVGGEPFRIAPDLHVVVGADACVSDAGEAGEVGLRLLGR